MTDRLDVVYGDRRVGTIVREGLAPEAVWFSYDRDWLAFDGAFPISTRMPLGENPFPPETAYVWFLNLLPEGADLPLIGRNLGVSHVDVLGLLGRMGRDLAGAVSIVPSGAVTAGAAQKARYRPLNEAELADAIRRLPERPLLAGEDGVRMSLAGNQSKLPVAKIAGGGLALPLDDTPSTHILKPAIDRLYGSVENEAFCLSLAAAAGLSVARAETGIADDKVYLLVRRYDRVREGKRVIRSHQEDFCQACGKPPYLKYESDFGYGKGPSIAECFAVIDAISTSRAGDRLALRDAIIYNLLINNVDAHAKNFSLLLNAGGNVRLAPLYDLMSGSLYERVTPNMAMRIAGKSRGDHIHARHWDRLAKAVGLAPLSLRKRVDELARALPPLADRLAEDMKAEHLNALVFRQVADAVKARCSRVLANLKNGPATPDEAEEPDDRARLDEASR